jgi:regulator of replication initiation timing
MQDETPPSDGEMFDDQAKDQGAREDEIAELNQKLNSVTKSYEDLRPHADRAFSAQKEKDAENQDLRARLAVLERESEISLQTQKPDPYSDENFLSDDDQRVLDDFPEVMKTSEKLAERMVRRQINQFKQQQLDDVEDRISKYVENKYEEPITTLNQKYDAISQQSYFDGKLGFGIWPRIEDDATFIEWVNQDSMRRLGMTQGDNEAKAQVIQLFLSGQGEEPYVGVDRQDQRRQQASQLMGSSQPQATTTDSTQGLSGEALFNAMAD